MESRARFLGHAIHPMLIVFPLGLLTTAVLFDIVHLLGGDESWTSASYHAIQFGLYGAALAALAGLIDWTKIPKGTRAKRIATLHGLTNVVAVALFFVAYQARMDDHSVIGAAEFVPAAIGALVGLGGGWLGGELVERLRVGVSDDAHLNAPSSRKQSLDGGREAESGAPARSA